MKIFILTENSRFFFKLNKALSRLGIHFRVLNKWDKLPKVNAIVLTTESEWAAFNYSGKNQSIILPYREESSFDKYVFKLLAVYTLGYKTFKVLTFSVDPGTKKIGLCVFLDEYYLNSHTISDKKELINKIKQYIEALSTESSNGIVYNFKLGRGVLQITLEIVDYILNYFSESKNVNIYLIDEAKSSQLKIQKKDRRIPKHEASALILALRKGIKVDNENRNKIMNQIKSEKKTRKDLKKQKEEIRFLYENRHLFKDIFMKILRGELSLNESLDQIRNCKNLTHIS